MTERAAPLALAVAAVAAVGVTGCGSSPSRPLTVGASRVLSADADRVEAAARSGSPARVLREVAMLRGDLADQVRRGQVDRGRAQQVADQLDRVVADTGAGLPGTPAATPTPAGSPAPVVPPVRGGAPGHGHGHGHGRG